MNSFNERIVKRDLIIQWDIKNDTLKLNFITKGFSQTKRGVLSFLCSIFNPLGFFESLFARNKVTDSRFEEEEIKLEQFTS